MHLSGVYCHTVAGNSKYSQKNETN